MPWWQGLTGLAGTLSDWITKRPKLKVVQKDDPGYYWLREAVNPKFGENHHCLFTVFVSNQSGQANTIVKYEVDITLPNGRFQPIQVEQGSMEDGNIEFGVTPVNLPPHNTHEAHIWVPLDARQLSNPIRLNVTVVDKHDNYYYGFCKIPNRYSKVRQTDQDSAQF